MKQRVNIRYCTHCGGVAQWEEFDPTATATMGNSIVKPRRDQFLADIPANQPGIGGMYAERTCQCPVSYVNTIY